MPCRSGSSRMESQVQGSSPEMPITCSHGTELCYHPSMQVCFDCKYPDGIMVGSSINL